jgi:long-chain acyl-CoA synthetase
MHELPALRRVVELLELRAKLTPNRTALVYRGCATTYADLDSKASQCSQWLRAARVSSGDRVVVIGVNSTNLVATIFGCLKAGAIFVPLNPSTPARRLEFILSNCDPAAVAIDLDLIGRYQCLTNARLPLLRLDYGNLDDPPLGSVDRRISNPVESPLPTKNVAAIIYTSGSTRTPRGVILPDEQVLFATTAINSVLGNTSTEKILCGLPLSFDYGLYQVFLAFQVGAAVVLERDFSLPMKIPRLLREYQITAFPGVPSLFAILLQGRLLERIDLPDLRYITSTGDIFPSAHIRRLRGILPNVTIFPMYGLTECKRVSIVPRGCLDGHESSVGRPLPGTRIALVNENGDELETGQVGELLVWGPHVMAGYWNLPDETERRFRRDPLTGEICLHTGDFFRVDGDGFLYFVGRDASFIKNRGEKVSLAEVEATISECANVAECAAVPVSDEAVGETIAVFIARTPDSLLSSGDIQQYCSEHLMPSARPKHIYIIEEALPRTANGKLDRQRLKLYGSGTLRTRHDNNSE